MANPEDMSNNNLLLAYLNPQSRLECFDTSDLNSESTKRGLNCAEKCIDTKKYLTLGEDWRRRCLRGSSLTKIATEAGEAAQTVRRA